MYVPPFDAIPTMNFFEIENDHFQWDVHILILGTLDASLRYLETDAKEQLAKLEAAMNKALNPDYHEHLVDEHEEVLDTNSRQEQFVRNMAFVALSSRLTHALRQMARSAESFSPRTKKYTKTSMSEFQRLWLEYEDRFGIDFVANADRIAFVESMREVRNQIVHDGSEANKFKLLEEIDLNGGDAGYVDLWFSEKYPDYVSGSGMNAEVSVSAKQLEATVKGSLSLVSWLAGELRTQELAIKKARNNP